MVWMYDMWDMSYPTRIVAKMRCSAIVATPIGELVAVRSGIAITHLLFRDGRHAASIEAVPRSAESFTDLRGQLEEYFSGARTRFDLTLAPVGTDFQLSVWRQLQRIPYGETISYGELANRIGNPRAARAVGGANNRNSIVVIIPCHRVIGGDKTLVGFGGGLERKKHLLALEGVALPSTSQLSTQLSLAL